MHRDMPQTRVKLATLFYPDQDEPTARRNLNTMLSRLRTILHGCPCIQSDNQTIQFDLTTPFLFDVIEFERNAQHIKDTGALEAAYGLYRGEFMEGYYDDWCIAQMAQKLGLRVSEVQGTVTIKVVLRDGAAEKAGFSSNDEWLGVEWTEGGKKGSATQAWRLNKVDDLPMLLGKQKMVTALVSRDKRLLRLPLTIPATSTTARLAVKDAKAVAPWMTGSKT